MNGDDWRRRYAPQIQADFERADRHIRATRLKLILIFASLVAALLIWIVLGGP